MADNWLQQVTFGVNKFILLALLVAEIVVIIILCTVERVNFTDS